MEPWLLYSRTNAEDKIQKPRSNPGHWTLSMNIPE